MARMRMLLFLTLIAGLFFSDVAAAQSGSEDILRQAQERAAKIAEYKELLSHPDQNVRVAALDVMLKSDDPAMREIAFNMAFASADDAMRAIALRNKFLYLQTLNFALGLRDNPTEVEQSAISEHFTNAYPIKLEEYDADSGALKFRGQYGTGQVSGIGLDFNDNYRKCSANMTLGDGPVLEGLLNCSQGRQIKGSYVITLRLQ